MKLTDEICEDIKTQVVDVLIYTKTCKIPIDPITIAKRLGLLIAKYSELNDRSKKIYEIKDGCSKYSEKDKWVICYNEQVKQERVKYTIAHEIGHFALGHTKDGEEEETEANFFAAYLLAPSPLIHNILDNPDSQSISCTFGISKEASGHAYERYIKWLIHAGPYKEYEKRLLKLFNLTTKIK